MTDSPRQGTKRQRDLKLELTWVGKDHRPRLEPRILLEDPEKNYHAAARVTDADQFENMLIFGDNLLALQSLATDPKVKGKVKCIFIDPPYNTGSAFEHYDDGMEHSLWLSMMRERLELLRELLSDDGSIWISIDDNEMPYLRVICDEIFGRINFVASFIWRKVDSPNDNKVSVTPDHEYIVTYAFDSKRLKLKRKSDPKIADAYGSIDENGRRYRDRLLKKNGKNSRKEDRPTMYFKIFAPDGAEIYPIHDDGSPARWAAGLSRVQELIKNNELIWKRRKIANEETWVPYTREYAPDSPERPYPTIWNDLTTMRQAKAHQKIIAPDVESFETPKPEELIQRILDIASNPGDLVLDSFAGSGTTGAVAHKMGRRWIMVELGEHAHTHIIPRMQKVIDGSDQGGISGAVGWKGGGGFRYFKLAPTLIKKDRRGNEIINPEYNAEMLAEACCKLKGFAFEPSASRELWWQQGRSSERDFLFVTTRYMDYASLQDLSEEVGPERTLLVLVKAYDRQGEVFDNLTLEKIPESVLHLAEWDKDDYSLKVENLPKAAPDKELVTTAQRAERRGSRKMAGVPDLFAAAGDDS